MAIHIHNVTRDDVYMVCGWDVRFIDATSTPINTVKVDAWISEAAAEINSILESKGVAVDALETVSENAYATIRRLICVGTALRMANIQGGNSSVRDDLRTEWEQGKRALERRSFHMLGNAQAPEAVLKSNIDTTKGKDYGPGGRRRISKRRW